jgi:hypothetical protein
MKRWEKWHLGLRQLKAVLIAYTWLLVVYLAFFYETLRHKHTAKGVGLAVFDVSAIVALMVLSAIMYTELLLDEYQAHPMWRVRGQRNNEL